MPSWQARALSFLLRHTFKRKLAAARDVLAVRAVMDSGGRYKPPTDVTIRQTIVNGVNGEWVEGKNKGPVMLFLHGGGCVACSPKTHRPYSCYFAQQGFRVFVPDYRLAPEHPFPAALEDAIAVYREIAPDVIAGDSAGGGLALATLLRLRDEGATLPRAAALFSPFTDLTGAGDSRKSNERRCAMFLSKGIDEISQHYAPDADLRNPLISPVYGDYTGFPPLLIHVGEDETLRDDSVRVADKAREAGVSVDLKIWPAVPHDWQLAYNLIPEGRASLEQATAFLKA